MSQISQIRFLLLVILDITLIIVNFHVTNNFGTFKEDKIEKDRQTQVQCVEKSTLRHD